MEKTVEAFLEPWQLGRDPSFPPALIVNGLPVYVRNYFLNAEACVLMVTIHLERTTPHTLAVRCANDVRQVHIAAAELEKRLNAYLQQLPDNA